MTKELYFTSFSCEVGITLTVRLSLPRNLTTAVATLQILAIDRQLVLVTEPADIAVLAHTADGGIGRDARAVNTLVAGADIPDLLVTQRSRPSGVAVAGDAGLIDGVAHAVPANVAGAAPWGDAQGHLQHAPEVLQLVVDPYIVNAAMEAVEVAFWTLAESCHP